MNPYLSFIVAARNDNYGGNFLHRMQVFINVLLSLWDKHGLDAELIIVEWNPPEDRPRLKDALTWPKCLKPGTVRIIEVPSEIHHRLPHSDRMPMFEYIAKNVGIRRARGEFVLTTNPDLLYSEALIKFLATRRLSKHCFYRIDRYDVALEVPLDMPTKKQLRFCAKHAFRVATVNGTVPIQKFCLHNILSKLRRILEYAKDPVQFSAKCLDFCRKVWKSRTHQAQASNFPSKLRLHTNASGDFFLMARQHWHKIRGYPEFKTHSFIDGYACFLASSLGLEQIVLKDPLRIYHQEHDRTEHSSRPLTDYQQYLENGKKMLDTRQPIIFNDEGWGLGYEQLREDQIVS